MVANTNHSSCNTNSNSPNCNNRNRKRTTQMLVESNGRMERETKGVRK